ncbi:hypothetical protein MO767_18245 [Pseudomonas sp. UYIF39]|uniref:hypothetical protein n=1 Tax=Pseudomonas sp. UYIF39 TaxID=1630747 RepID=UPI00249DA325|nr:hypothetical protein [Pseudomonas sp. UYIF39]MDI3356276.1 hypothetical protein [Pseudomonas sp. UYIF39]
MRPTIISGKKNPAGRPGSLLSTTKTSEVKKLQKRDAHSDNVDAHAQAILAPIVSTINYFCTAQNLDGVRREPEEFGCTDSELLRDVIKFFGGQKLALCDVLGSDRHYLQVAGSSYGLTKALRDKRSDGLDTGLPVVWICTVTGRAFPISTLMHLLDVVGLYARRGTRKAASI